MVSFALVGIEVIPTGIFGQKAETFSCCGSAFATKGELEAHQKKAHGGKM